MRRFWLATALLIALQLAPATARAQGVCAGLCVNPILVAATLLGSFVSSILNVLLGDPGPMAVLTASASKIHAETGMATATLKNAQQTERTQILASMAAQSMDFSDQDCSLSNLRNTLAAAGGAPGAAGGQGLSGDVGLTSLAREEIEYRLAGANTLSKLSEGGGGGGQEDSFIFPELQQELAVGAICKANLPAAWKNEECQGVDPQMRIVRYSEMLGQEVYPKKEEERLGLHLWLAGTFQTPPELVSGADFQSPDGTKHTVQVLQAATRASYGAAPIARSAAEILPLDEFESLFTGIPEKVKQAIKSNCNSERCVTRFLVEYPLTQPMTGSPSAQYAELDTISNYLLNKILERQRMLSEVDGVRLINALQEE